MSSRPAWGAVACGRLCSRARSLLSHRPGLEPSVAYEKTARKAMPQPLTGWISESGAIESATSVRSAPPTSATSPRRHSGLVAYESSTWLGPGRGLGPSSCSRGTCMARAKLRVSGQGRGHLPLHRELRQVGRRLLLQDLADVGGGGAEHRKQQRDRLVLVVCLGAVAGGGLLCQRQR